MTEPNASTASGVPPKRGPGTAARAVGYGFLAWLLPFVVSVGIFPLKKGHPPLFESLMAVVVAATAVGLGCRYLRGGESGNAGRAAATGFLWMGISIGVDLLLFTWGPMAMSFPAYMADIGVTYLIFPLVLAGLGAAGDRR